jgi:molybdopterin synthase catalytic subunit
LSETSVAVVVAAPHRGDAFDAARWCIDTLKETVPIWKREHWSGGSAWVDGTPIRSLDPAAPSGGD